MQGELEDYVKELDIDAEIIDTRKDISTVSKAAKALEVEEDEVIKTLLFKVDEGIVVAITNGDRRVSEEKLRRRLDVEECRLCTPREVKDATGYPVGEVPPIPYREWEVLLEEDIMGMEYVYGGGGTKTSMLKIRVNDLRDINDAEVADISEKYPNKELRGR